MRRTYNDRMLVKWRATGGLSAYLGGGVHAACGYNSFKSTAEDPGLQSSVVASRGIGGRSPAGRRASATAMLFDAGDLRPIGPGGCSAVSVSPTRTMVAS